MGLEHCSFILYSSDIKTPWREINDPEIERVEETNLEGAFYCALGPTPKEKQAGEKTKALNRAKGENKNAATQSTRL